MTDKTPLVDAVTVATQPSGHATTDVGTKAGISPSLYFLANLALAGAQISFGIGAVVGELGLPATNPVLFGFIREGIAGPMLIVMALAVSHHANLPLFPATADLPRFFLCGFALFGNQFCSITGIKLAGGVAQSVWQPTQPIFSLLLAVIFGLERPTLGKVFGIAISFVGVAFMVLYGAETDSHSVGAQLSGNAMFFLNCLGTAVYVVASKPLLNTYHSVAVTGYSYFVASLMMGVACVIVNSVPVLLDFVCPESDKKEMARAILSDSCGNGWEIPTGALWALAYWILMNSIFSYCLITWGNQFVDASLVCAYTVLQPVAAAVMSVIIRALWKSKRENLHPLSTSDLGVIGIFVGLALVVWDVRRTTVLQRNQDEKTRALLDN